MTAINVPIMTRKSAVVKGRSVKLISRMEYGQQIFVYTVFRAIRNVRSAMAAISQKSGVVPVQWPGGWLICCLIFLIIIRVSGMVV